MGIKVACSKTAEQLKEEAERLHEGIAAQVEELTKTGGWAAFLRVAVGFHQFSFSNLLLIWSQCPGASRVAGYRQWQQRGRQVKKGEQGIRIFGYATKRIEPDTDGDEERRAAYFPVLTVFDIAQTEPMEGVEEVPELAPRLIGSDDTGIFDATAEWLRTLGWTVERASLAGEDGRSIMDGTHRVQIHDGLEAAHEALTLLHETAHVVLHSEVTDYQQHRGIYETEAESVAHIVAGVLGLDTSTNSVGYIATWTHGDTDIVKATAVRVLATVRPRHCGFPQARPSGGEEGLPGYRGSTADAHTQARCSAPLAIVHLIATARSVQATVSASTFTATGPKCTQARTGFGMGVLVRG